MFTKFDRNLTKTSCLTFPFEQAQNVSLSYRSLHITYDRTSRSLTLHELNTDLGYVTSVSGTAKNLIYLSKLYWLILFRAKKLLVLDKRFYLQNVMTLSVIDSTTFLQHYGVDRKQDHLFRSILSTFQNFSEVSCTAVMMPRTQYPIKCGNESPCRPP